MAEGQRRLLWSPSESFLETLSLTSSRHSHSNSVESMSSETSVDSILGIYGVALDRRESRETVSRNTSLTSNGSLVLNTGLDLKERITREVLKERDEDEHTPIIDRVLRRDSFFPTRRAPRPPFPITPAKPTRKPNLTESWIDLSEDDDDEDNEDDRSLPEQEEEEEEDEPEPMPIQPYRRKKLSAIVERGVQSTTLQKIEGDILRMLTENQTTEPLRLTPKAATVSERRKTSFGGRFMDKMRRSLSKRNASFDSADTDWRRKRTSYVGFDYMI